MGYGVAFSQGSEIYFIIFSIIIENSEKDIIFVSAKQGR
jgi:hypothetical protein